MKISSELSTGVRLTGTTITDTPRTPVTQVQSVQNSEQSPDRDSEQPDMKDAGIGRKIDMKV